MHPTPATCQASRLLCSTLTTATPPIPRIQPDAPVPTVYRETTFAPGSVDPRTAMIDIDRTTGRLATEFTPPANIVQRRVYIEELPGYAPDPTPAPLRDEKPDPAALKAVKGQSSTLTPTAP